MALPNAVTSFSDLGQQPQGNTPQSDNTTNFNVGLLVNQNQVAEGPTIPPPQQGQYRIPRPSNFGVASITNAKPMGALIVFTWLDIDSFGSNLGEYRILANYAYDSNATPVEVGSSQNSPCSVQVLAPVATSAVFYLRPYLSNGQTLPLEECPTCAVNIPAPTFQFRDAPDTVYIDSNRPTGGGSSTVTQTFTNSGTFTVPANVSSITVQCYGPGGNGAGAGNAGGPNGGGGGGGGAYASSILSVTAGNVYMVNVGLGGTQQPSWFISPTTVLADYGVNSTSATAGTGGTTPNSIGSTLHNGATGSNASGGTSGNGGAGAAPAGGAGGTGTATPVGTGGNGTGPAGGGAGGGPGGGPQGLGADGQVILTYTMSGSGTVTSGFGIVNDAGQVMSLTDSSLLFLNPNGKQTINLGTASAAANAPGYITISDGVGSTNDVTFLPGSAASAGASSGKYLLVTLGGTSYKLQLLSP